MIAILIINDNPVKFKLKCIQIFKHKTDDTEHETNICLLFSFTSCSGRIWLKLRPAYQGTYTDLAVVPENIQLNMAEEAKFSLRKVEQSSSWLILYLQPLSKQTGG